jgi:hypothetical protein
MQLQAVVRSQYRAALAMLRQAVEACPEALWDDPRDPARFWHVAYHALFYTHLYLQESEAAFRPWARHVPESHRLPTAVAPYRRADVLEYLDVCLQQVDEQTARLNPGAPSGFAWLPFDKLELQFYNIRHIQQHAGELMERLGSRAGLELHWVGTRPD